MEIGRKNNSNIKNTLIKNSRNLTINHEYRQNTIRHKHHQNDKQQ